jgi:hypothetical protein
VLGCHPVISKGRRECCRCHPVSPRKWIIVAPAGCWDDPFLWTGREGGGVRALTVASVRVLISWLGLAWLGLG